MHVYQTLPELYPARTLAQDQGNVVSGALVETFLENYCQTERHTFPKPRETLREKVSSCTLHV